MNASIRDIARISGVPKSTVARVMNNDATVKQVTKNKVLRTLRRLDAARGSKGMQAEALTRTIGFVVPAIQENMDPFAVRGMAAAQAFVEGTEYACTVLSQGTVDAICRDQIKGRAGLKCGGMVFYCPQGKWEPAVRILRSWDIPVAVIRRKTEISGVVTIHDNDYKGARLAMEHLHSLGHTSIAYATRTVGSEMMGRQQAYSDYVRENGLASHASLVYDWSREGYADALEHAEQVRSWLKDIIASDLKPTAFFGFDDVVAKGLIYCLMDLGYSVPRDFAVMGYDNDGGPAVVDEMLTTVDIPVGEMVNLAFKSVFDSFQGIIVEKADLEVANELVIRRSCGSK